MPSRRFERTVVSPERLDDLAVFGGEPAFTEPRHVGRPNLGDRARVLELIGGAMDRVWLSNEGPLHQEFQARVREVTGARHCVVVANATVGLQIAAKAMGMEGEILMPSFTFVGTPHAVSWLGLDPVFVEIDARTHTLDPAAVRAAIGPRTGGIVGVHLWGRSGGAAELEAIAEEHDIPLLFDAAHAFGCTADGRPVATLGDASVVSFHATKVVGAGEGGAILTDDPELAHRVRLMRNFGFVDFDAVGELGTNAKMSELSAAMGLASLDAFTSFVAANRRNYERYREGLRDAPAVQVIDYADGDEHNFHYVVIEVPAACRDALVRVLLAENVLARRYFHPGCHRLGPYRDGAAPLLVTETVAGRVVTLPTGTAMSGEDVDRVCAIIRLAMTHADELERRLVADTASLGR